MISGHRKIGMKVVVASLSALSLTLLMMGPCGLLERSALAAAYTFRATTNINVGDVVVWDSGTPRGVRTTNAAGSDYVAGVAAETVTAGNDCAIRQDGGRVTVNVTGSVDPSVNPWLVTSGATGRAQGVGSLESDGIFARAITSDGTPAAGQVYATVNLGFLGYGPSGVDDDIPDTDDWTEAQMELSLSDSTDVFTNNDGALNDDSVSLADVQTATTSDFHNIGGADDDIPDTDDWTEANLENSLSDVTNVLTDDDIAGTSFPGSASEGDIFWHETRNVRYQYDGGAWLPIQSYGALTLYVDDGAGSDVAGYGYGSGADATATIQYAIDNCVPTIIGGNVTINVDTATYSEATIPKPFSPSGAYKVTILGTLTSVDTGTADADSTTAIIEDDGQGWTPSAHAGQLVIITGGTGSGQERFIRDNDADSLNIAGLFATAPDATSTFIINTLGTIISPGAGNTGATLTAVSHWEFKYLEFSAGLRGIAASDSSQNITVISCAFNTQTATGINAQTSSNVAINNAYIHASSLDGIRVTYASVVLYDVYILGCNTSNNAAFGGVKLQGGGYAAFIRCYIDGNNRYGVLNTLNSTCLFYAATLISSIVNHDTAGDVGVYSETGSTASSVTTMTFNNNDDDEEWAADVGHT